MKKVFIVIICFVLTVSCNEGKKEITKEVEGDSSSVTNSSPVASFEELKPEKLDVGAERYFGEYVRQDSIISVRIVFRKHPVSEVFVANNIYIENRKPILIDLWYNQKVDQLSNRWSKNQLKFSTMKLDESGQILTDINFDLGIDESDTTIYIRKK